MSMTRYFTPVPNVPNGLNPGEANFLTALKGTVDLLAGFSDPAHTAVCKGEVTTESVASTGATSTFDATNYGKLVTQVEQLRLALNDLLTRIK